MIGMILCGGLGKRFLPVTEDIPKTLFEMRKDYTLMDKQIFQYKSAGIDRVFLLTAHLGEKIEKKFGKRHMGIEIEYVREKKPLGTLNAIRLGLERAQEDVIVSNGDVVADLNVKQMINEWKESGALGSIFVTKLRSPFGIVEMEGRRITGFREKPLLNKYINAGFYCLSRQTLPILEKFKVGDIEKTAFPELARKKKLTFYKEDGPLWMSIDSPKDLQNAQKEYSNRRDKPWGFEKTLRLDKKTMEKLLYIMANYRTSLHRHEIRDETLTVDYGAGYVEYENGERRRFSKGSKIHIKPYTVHSFVATKNTMLREISTPHPEDVVRVKDFYAVR